MIRASLAPNAAYAYVNLTPGVGVQFENRGGTGLSSTSTGGKGGAAPVYFKLLRAGDLFTGFQSPDGTNWTPVGSATIPAGPAVYVGLAVTAHNDARLSRATFTNVRAAAATPVDTTAPAAPVIARISDDTGTSSSDRITRDNRLIFSGTAEANSTVTLRRNNAVIGQASVNGTGAWSFDYSAVALPDGSSTFTATAADAAGNVSANSAAFAVTVDTAAPAVASGVFDYKAPSATLTLAEPVYGTFAPSAVTVRNLTTGQTVAATATYTAGSRTVKVTFASGPLADGNYRLSMSNAGLTDLAGNAVAPYTLDFFGPRRRCRPQRRGQLGRLLRPAPELRPVRQPHLLRRRLQWRRAGGRGGFLDPARQLRQAPAGDGAAGRLLAHADRRRQADAAGGPAGVTFRPLAVSQR